MVALINGFKFGLVLQVAVGPVCFFIFQAAINRGFFNAETGVLAVVLVDGLYIALAVLGVSALIEKTIARKRIKFFGAVVLFLFGANIFLEAAGFNFLPDFGFLSAFGNFDNSFLKGLVLTASNPLTILFWSGVFSTRIVEEKMDQKKKYLFGLGAVLSTLLFLTCVATAGNITNHFLPLAAITVLNLLVAALFCFFAARLALRKG